MQRFKYAALIALTVVLMPQIAQARHHRHHHRHYHHIVVHKQPHIATQSSTHAFVGYGGLIGKARGYIGMTARQIGLSRHSLWCANFIRYLGVKGDVDDRAISFLHLPHVGKQVGAIAVFSHHVGIVTGIDANGNITLISGNYRNRVYEGPYGRRPLAYVAAL